MLIPSQVECASFEEALGWPSHWNRVVTTWPYPLFNREIFKDNTKKEAVNKYEATFVDMLLSDDKSMEEFRRLQRMVRDGMNILLVCRCKTAPCHAHIIKKMVLDSSINEAIGCQKIKI